MSGARVFSALMLYSTLLLLLLLSSASVSARSVISIKVNTAQHEHAHHERSGTCAPQSCNVRPDDTNVCGSDGKVYYNECLFQNAQCRNAALAKVTDWNGYHCPTTCTKPIVCKEIGKFLCGSDGNVYFGYCRLYSAQCVDAALQEIECPQGLIQIPPRRRQ